MDSSHCILGLSEGTPHTCLQPLGSSTGQNLVDMDDMEGVKSYLDVKAIFATASLRVLFGTVRGSLQDFKRELFIFI